MMLSIGFGEPSLQGSENRVPISAGRLNSSSYYDAAYQEALHPAPPMATLFTVAHSSVRCWIRALDSMANCQVSVAVRFCCTFQAVQQFQLQRFQVHDRYCRTHAQGFRRGQAHSPLR